MRSFNSIENRGYDRDQLVRLKRFRKVSIYPRPETFNTIRRLVFGSKTLLVPGQFEVSRATAAQVYSRPFQAF